MVNYGNILVPLYIYPLHSTDPTGQFAWKPLIDAAKQYPNVTFTAVINPSTGPGSVPGECPNNDYTTAIPQLNAISNIDVMGYVHTAARWDCGPDGNWICPCTQPLESIQRNISAYAQWPTSGCKDWSGNSVNLQVDSIFVDEAPGTNTASTDYGYMSNVTQFIRSSGFQGGTIGTVLFNPGAQTDYSYFDLADNIIVLENNEQGFIASNVSALDDGGRYAGQSSMIITSHTTDSASIQQDTDIVLNRYQDSLAALYISDLSVYSAFPTIWSEFVGVVDQVVQGNKQACSANPAWGC